MVNQLSTTFYQYGYEVEYVLCSKGRPFVTLVSSNKSRPTTTLIDHNLVRELGLKINDLQCKKFYYCGEQLRILGTISTTVQCISEGFVCGSFQLRANVIEHLSKTFGVHSIAGMKLTKMLQPDAVKINDQHCTSSGAQSPANNSQPSSPKKSSPHPPSNAETTTAKTVTPLPVNEVKSKDASNLFLLQWNAALADSGNQHDQPGPAGVEDHESKVPVESVVADPIATDGSPDDPVKVTLLTLSGDETVDVWPGGVTSQQPIPWCHPEAHLVPWLVDDELTPNILCVNGVPSHYARGNCLQCQAPIDPDATIDPNVTMCTNCYIKEEIQRRRKRK